MTYEQHNETFHYEMNKLEETSPFDKVFVPTNHVHEMWALSTELMRELDQLDARGTNIPDLTLTAIRLRAKIFDIPEQRNIEIRAKEAQNDGA